MTFPILGLDKFATNEVSSCSLDASVKEQEIVSSIDAKMRHAKFPINRWTDQIFPTLTTSLGVRYKKSPPITFLVPCKQYQRLIFARNHRLKSTSIGTYDPVDSSANRGTDGTVIVRCACGAAVHLANVSRVVAELRFQVSPPIHARGEDKWNVFALNLHYRLGNRHTKVARFRYLAPNWRFLRPDFFICRLGDILANSQSYRFFICYRCN